MQKVWKVIFTISIAINLVLGFILLDKSDASMTNSKVYIERIDSLELVLDSLNIRRDSIKKRIDTVEIFFDKIIVKYEKDRNIIINNSVIDDYLFFTEYLRTRFDSCNNSQTVKRN